MGTQYRQHTFNDITTSEALLKAWRELQQEDMYRRGHDSYRGTYGECSLRVSAQSFPTAQAAQKFVDSYEGVAKRDAVAWRFGDMSKVFPSTAKDKELVATHQKLEAELLTFEHDILKRFLASKSASKRCTHCDSVISKKSRLSLVTRDFKKMLETLQGFDRADFIREQTSCPACGHELLMTETDKKRKSSLTTRLADVQKRLQEAKTTFKKTAQPYGYLVLAAVPE